VKIGENSSLSVTYFFRYHSLYA